MNLRRKVLILDQVGERCRKLECLLNQAGYTVDCASNGNDGLAMACKFKPDLVLLNIQLPNPSAWEVCGRIKQDTSASKPCVIILFPGLSGPLVLMEDMMSGTDGFIDYSLSDAEILDRLEDIFRTKCSETSSPSTHNVSNLADNLVSYAQNKNHEAAKLIQAEESLRETKNWLRMVMDAIPVCVHWKNRDSVYIGCNRSFARDAELESPGQIAGKTDFDLPWKCYADLYRSRDRMVIQTGKAMLQYEQPRVSSDGRLFWLRQSKLPLRNAADEIIGILTIYEDITESRNAQETLQRVRLELEQRVRERTSELSIVNMTLKTESEERLRAAQEIERLNRDLERRAADLVAANNGLKELDRLKSEFLATMSHELRTPLNSIIGFTGILRQGLAGAVNDEQSKQLGIVYNSAMHLLNLINDLLDISRIEAGKVEWDNEPFDFQQVACDVSACLSPMAAQKKIGLVLDLPDTPLNMTGDRKRCYQILLNLTNNALKFTEQGEVRVTARRQEDMLRVEVSDTGIGIKPEHIGMLFEAFRQVDSSAKRVYEGTGLGLHLCRRLLQLIGGEISVTSQHGAGSCFTFKMPLHSSRKSQNP